MTWELPFSFQRTLTDTRTHTRTCTHTHPPHTHTLSSLSIFFTLFSIKCVFSMGMFSQILLPCKLALRSPHCEMVQVREQLVNPFTPQYLHVFLSPQSLGKIESRLLPIELVSWKINTRNTLVHYLCFFFILFSHLYPRKSNIYTTSF